MHMKIPNGFNIIPVQNKVPMIAWKEFTERLQTSEERQKFLNSGEQLGIVTGKVSKIFVLDDDGGLDHGKYPIPKTWEARTPRGGAHYYFRWTSELENKITTKTEILPKVDVRGEGGYVVHYGFRQPTGIVPLSCPPTWLIDLLPNKDRNDETVSQHKPDNWIIEALENIQPGNGANGRTPTFVRVIGRLKAKGLNESEISGLLSPYAEKYDYRKLDNLIGDQFKRYPVPVRKEDLETSNSLTDFLLDTKAVPYIVPGCFAENTINILAGLQESRKSWILLDLAVAIASGTSWLDQYKCERRKVLIIDQERPRIEMQRRISALLAGRDLTVADLEGQLIPKVGTTFRINLEQSFDKLVRWIEEMKPEVVLVDSLKTFQTGIITDNQSMQEVFERVKELRSRFGLTFIILHHENKGAYARTREGLEITAENIAGAASIVEVPEGIFVSVNKDADSSLLYHVKNSYGTKQSPRLVKVVDLNESKSKIKVQGF